MSAAPFAWDQRLHSSTLCKHAKTSWTTESGTRSTRLARRDAQSSNLIWWARTWPSVRKPRPVNETRKPALRADSAVPSEIGQTIASLNHALNARGETTRQKCLPVFNRLAHGLGGIAIYPCDGPPCYPVQRGRLRRGSPANSMQCVAGGLTSKQARNPSRERVSCVSTSPSRNFPAIKCFRSGISWPVATHCGIHRLYRGPTVKYAAWTFANPGRLNLKCTYGS